MRWSVELMVWLTQKIFSNIPFEVLSKSFKGFYCLDWHNMPIKVFVFKIMIDDFAVLSKIKSS